MGLKPRSPTDGEEAPGSGYVSTITTQELNKYHAAEYADGYPSDEDADEDDDYMDEPRGDKPSIATKLSSAVKNFSLPSPEDIKNSNFYKSFQQPLMVKTKVQKPKVLEANQAMTAGKTPAELSKISKLSEFPLPTIRRLEDKETSESGEQMTNGDVEQNDIHFDGFGYNSLPRSLRETKLITSVKESDPDDEKLIQRMETAKNMTPAQLAEIKSIKDFPIPNKIKSLLDRPAKPMTNGKVSMADVTDNGDEANEEKKSFFSLPESFMETKLLTNVKECTDYDTLKKRRALTETKTPKELSAISGLSDFPIPTKLENLLKMNGEDSANDEEPAKEFNLETLKNMEFSVPPSFKIELAVGSVVEDEEVARQHKELVETKSVAELSQLNSVTDFPIPDAIENILKKRKDTDDSDTMKASNLSLAAITSGKILPESLRETKLITNIKVEKDQEKLLARQSIVKNQTPMELGSIKNLHDFPIPAPLQRLHLPASFSRSASKKSLNNIDSTDSPMAPPRQKSCNASIYESLPSSLRNEVIVRSRPITDEESKSRQELIRSKSPVELSQISSIKDFPVPKSIEKLFEKPEGEDAVDDGQPQPDFMEKYATLPSSMKTSLLVGAKIEDQDLVSERSETVKAKSVHELSEIKSLNDIPIPSTLQRLAKRDYAPVERKKLFKMQMKSASLQSLSIQGTLPRSLREKQLLVGSKVEDPEVLNERKAVVESKSVAELSKVSSIADFPVPTFLSKLASRSLSKLHSLSTGQLSSPTTEDKSTGSGIYATLPKSLNCELLVSRSVQDVSILEERMQLINEKSTKELASIRSYKDFPVPDIVQRFYHKSMDRLHNRPSEVGEDGSIVSGQSMPSLKLPAMLTQPCIVTTKVEDPQVLLERQQIQQQKSIHELSKIRNLNEFPVPGNIITLPDVPIPKMKDMLQVIARTPMRKTPKNPPVPPSEETESNVESSQLEEEDEYSNLDNIEDSYEVISKEPTESPQVEVEPFGLATQVRGTPERSTRGKKNKKPEPRNRRSQEEKEERLSTTVTPTPPNTATEEFETPPPLPPKRSPQKSMSVESQQSVELEGSPAPVRGILTLEAMNGNIQVIKNEAQTMQQGGDGIQSRPLPAPPAPVRYGRSKEKEAAAAASAAADRTLVEESQKFQTCRESLATTTQSRTLLGTDEDDNTMADSIVESLVSCTDTLICDDTDENEFDDDPYPSVNFEGGASELVDLDPQHQGKRLEEGTQQLSQELMNHVESLKSTLDNMSNRLGARSRSRSSSRPRSTSRTRLMGLHQDKV